MLCLDLNSEENVEITKVFRIPDVDDDVNVPLAGHPRTLTISRDPRSRQRRTDRSAFCFHAWCYSILKWKLEDFHESVAFKLARTLTPDPALWENACERRQDLDSINGLQLLADRDSRLLLMSELHILSRLPAELRTYIWQDIGLMTPCSAFILVTGETSRLARNLHCPSTRHIILERGSRISAKMISVFGTEYIQELNVDTDSEGDLVGDTTEVKYFSSLHGICAIQVLGIDWESGLIGKIPNTDCVWHGIIKASVPTFRCDYNVS